MAYVYRHIRLDKNIPFYIGIGSDNKGKFSRANRKENRNIHWHDIVNRYGYRVDILWDDISWEEAITKEIEFISMYGRVDINTGTLVNLTSGGQGNSGMIYSKETREKMKIAACLPNRIKITKENLKKAHDKVKNETESERRERLFKISESLRGSKRTDQQRNNISLSLKGKKKSLSHVKNMSISRIESYLSGKRKPSVVPLDKRRKKGQYSHSTESKIKIGLAGIGRKVSEETRQKHREFWTGRKHTPESIEKMKLIHSERAKNRVINYVLVYDENMNYIHKYENVRIASKELKVSSTSIYKVLNRKRNSMSGYIFKMEN